MGKLIKIVLNPLKNKNMETINKIMLTKEELGELVGGYVVGEENPDIINDNTKIACTCTYVNYSAIQNNNSERQCSCICVKEESAVFY